MGPQPIRLLDFGRILFGHLPWTFAVELVIRMTFVYVLLLVAMRLMGKRMASQATRNELAALVSLAAAVGPAIQDPQTGLLPAAIIAAVVIGVQRGVAILGRQRVAFEKLTQDAMTVIIDDGVLDVVALRGLGLSRERVMAQLRASQITNLGAVQRMYFEMNGAFTVVRSSDPRPGLSSLPSWDGDQRSRQRAAEDSCACTACGFVAPDIVDVPFRCQRCCGRQRERAVLD